MKKIGNNKKILLIDDSDILVKLLDRFFTEAGFEFFSANNGFAGLKVIQEKQPDLVLCDMNLPYKDGIQFLEEKNKIDQLKNIPVIMLTVDHSVKTVRTAIGLGALDFIVKPFNLEELLERIYSLWTNIDKDEKLRNKISAAFYWDADVLIIDISGEISQQGLTQLKYKLIDETRLIDSNKLKIILKIDEEAVCNFETDFFNFLGYVFFSEINVADNNVVINTLNNDIIKIAKSVVSSQAFHFIDKYVSAMNYFSSSQNEYYKELNLADLPDNTRFDYPLYNADGKTIVNKDNIISSDLKKRLVFEGINSLFYRNNNIKFQPLKNPEELITLNKSIIQEEVFLGRKILIAEDSHNLRMHIGNALRKYGLNVVYAEDGKEAIKHVTLDKPDLILLDLLMPVMNGISFLNHARKNNITIPVIIMSATPVDAVFEQLKEYNISGFVIKPFKMAELIEKIKAAILKKK